MSTQMIRSRVFGDTVKHALAGSGSMLIAEPTPARGGLRRLTESTRLEVVAARQALACDWRASSVERVEEFETRVGVLERELTLATLRNAHGEDDV